MDVAYLGRNEQPDFNPADDKEAGGEFRAAPFTIR